MQDVSPKFVSHRAAGTVHSWLQYSAMLAICTAASLLLRGESSVVEILSAVTFFFPQLFQLQERYLISLSVMPSLNFWLLLVVILKRKVTE